MFTVAPMKRGRSTGYFGLLEEYSMKSEKRKIGDKEQRNHGPIMYPSANPMRRLHPSELSIE
jgi:hypothetical protein